MASNGRQRGGQAHLNDHILKTGIIQQLRQRVLAGGDLSMSEILELLSSHEQLRAVFLARQYRVNALQEENEALINALRRTKKSEADG